jgi:hypothetical protein
MPYETLKCLTSVVYSDTICKRKTKYKEIPYQY